MQVTPPVCLVTGGAGYIGSHTVRYLTAHGVRVIILDNHSRSSRISVEGIEVVVGDIRNQELVSALCKENGVSSIIHFGGLKNVGESMLQPSTYFSNNVTGSIGLIETAIHSGVTNFVFSSSCSVIGDPSVLPVDEHAPLNPQSVYAETKAMVERALFWFGSTQNFRFVNLRYFNAAGASEDGIVGEDWDNTQNLIPIAMKALLKGSGPLKVYGDDYETPDGTCIRDYVHVEDLAEAHFRALQYLWNGGESTTLNLGTGAGHSVMEILDAICDVSGNVVPHVVVARRLGDPAKVFADTSLARKVLNWSAQRNLSDIVLSAYRWHSKSL
jgi:UDP-glucose-4-epimerase GalE